MEVLGLLLIRVSIACVYLYAAYQNCRNKAARDWTVQHTAIARQNTLQVKISWVDKWLAAGLMLVMILASLLLLFGLLIEVAIVGLVVFSALGIVQHWREANIMVQAYQSVNVNEHKSTLDEVCWSAFSGQYSSGLKNFALIGCLIGYFVLFVS